MIWVRVEIMGSQKCGMVGKYQSVLIMISSVISTRNAMRVSFLGVALLLVL
jgi:hypothetical protein